MSEERKPILGSMAPRVPPITQYDAVPAVNPAWDQYRSMIQKGGGRLVRGRRNPMKHVFSPI